MASRRRWRVTLVAAIVCVMGTFTVLICLEVSYVARLSTDESTTKPTAVAVRTMAANKPHPGRREVQWEIVSYQDNREPIRAQRRVTDAPNNESFYTTAEPSMGVERKRLQLRLRDETRELWWMLRGKLKKTHDRNLKEVLQQTAEDVHGLLLQVENLGEALEGSDSHRQLSELMQRRLQYLQNPSNCSQAKRAVCRLAKPCGFACQIHHLTYCFIVAYATQRTLIVVDQGWKYSLEGWEKVFQPLSRCTVSVVPPLPGGNVLEDESDVITLPTVDALKHRIPQLPQAIPRDLASKIALFHGAPFVWFISQFLRYITRPSQQLEEYLEKEVKQLNFSRPIVGIHVRRTDKIKTEAAYHHIKEYMREVEEWFVLTGQERRVFIATDDPSVLIDAKKLYPQYTFLSNTRGSSLASHVSSRYSLDSAYDVILDITLLSLSDYLVCTFSSQVCRLAYELMQQYHVDASQRYYSLDDIYYFGGQHGHQVRAIQSHTAKTAGQLSFEVGDLILIAGNEKDGESVGKLMSRIGRFPSRKVEEVFIVEDFPTYSNVT